VTPKRTINTAQLAELLGHRNLATTRNWLSRHQIKPVGRETDSGLKLWPLVEVQREINDMPIGPAKNRYTSTPTAPTI
jgi:hypothetical protein